MTDLALSDQVSHGCDGLLDRNLRVHAVQVVQVDGLHSQPAQRCVAVGGDAAGMSIQLDPALAPDDAELRGDLKTVACDAAGGDGSADDLLIVALPVAHGGVEHRDAGVEGCMDGGQGLPVVGWTVPLGQAHAAESQGGGFQGAQMVDRGVCGFDECHT